VTKDFRVNLIIKMGRAVKGKKNTKISLKKKVWAIKRMKY
jgi:hypothetical protein